MDFILLLVKRLKTLKSAKNAPAELAEVLGDLFRIRSTQVLASLTALEQTLKKNIETTSSLKELNKEYKKVNKTLNETIIQYHNINREIGKAFVTGLIGGENFNLSLQKINQNLKGVQKNAQITGIFLKNMFLKFPAGPIFAINEILDLKMKEAQETVDKGIREVFEKINKGLKGKLDVTGLKDLLALLETFGAVNLKLDTATFDALTRTLKQQLEIQQAQTVENTKKEKSIYKQVKGNQLLLEHSLEVLKLMGVTNSEALKIEKSLRQRLKLEEDYKTQLSDELKRVREIKKEKELEADLSQRTLKLFEIAKTSGSRIASQIADVLSGQIDFSTFVRRGGEAVDIFKKQFKDVFETEQAKAFFKGERVPGLEKLRGGTNITLPVEDQALVKARSEILNKAKIEVSLAQRRLEIEREITNLRQLSLQNPAVVKSVTLKTPIPATGSSSIVFKPGAFQIEANLSKEEQLKNIQESMKKMATPGTKENKQLRSAIMGKQSTNLPL